MRFLTEGMEAMAFTDIEYQAVKNEVAAFVEKIRPPVEIRHDIDITFRIEGQFVELCELRPPCKEIPGEIPVFPFARIDYVRRNDEWKLFWMADGRWELYTVTCTLREALAMIVTDSHDRFFGTLVNA